MLPGWTVMQFLEKGVMRKQTYRSSGETGGGQNGKTLKDWSVHDCILIFKKEYSIQILSALAFNLKCVWDLNKT